MYVEGDWWTWGTEQRQAELANILSEAPQQWLSDGFLGILADVRACDHINWARARTHARQNYFLKDLELALNTYDQEHPIESRKPSWMDELAEDAQRQQNEHNNTVSSVQWPHLADEALHGLAGDIVRTIDPYTEADPVATLLNILAGTGNMIGDTPHARVQHDQHPARLNVVQVGESSKGRKGTGWSTPRYILSRVDEAWATSRLKGGLSSGEGLIYNVRDAQTKREPIKHQGRVIDYQEVEADPGEHDKRLLIVEPEFASVLTVMGREKNILSAVIRQAWDDGNLSPLTRNNPMTATGAHISIVGHITKQELLVKLDHTSKGNGFGNRFLWAVVKRSKLLPRGEAAPDHILNPLIHRLQEVFTFSRTISEIKRDAAAEVMWDKVYGPLSEGKHKY